MRAEWRLLAIALALEVIQPGGLECIHGLEPCELPYPKTVNEVEGRSFGTGAESIEANAAAEYASLAGLCSAGIDTILPTMATQPPQDVLKRIRKLASLSEEISKGSFGAPVTRLTVIKSLCREPELANRFVAYLARKTYERLGKKGDSSAHRAMMEEALTAMDAWQQAPSQKLRETLGTLHSRMRAEQDEYRKIPSGAVRLINDNNLLVFEYAVSCFLMPEWEVGQQCCQTARQYAERYAPSEGTGLISASVPFVQDIADFWIHEYSLSGAEKKRTPHSSSNSSTHSSQKEKGSAKMEFTPRQGQFLAFIHLYWKLHRRGPAETDMTKFFRVTPPSIHGMVVKLEELGLVTREQGVARSVRVAVPAHQLPELEDVPGPPW